MSKLSGLNVKITLFCHLSHMALPKGSAYIDSNEKVISDNFKDKFQKCFSSNEVLYLKELEFTLHCENASLSSYD